MWLVKKKKKRESTNQRISESTERGTTGRLSGQFISESTERGTTGSEQFINVGAVPLCPPVGWLGGVRLFVYSSIRLFVYSSIRLFVYSSIRLFVYSSIRLFVYSSIRLFVYSCFHGFSIACVSSRVMYSSCAGSVILSPFLRM